MGFRERIPRRGTRRRWLLGLAARCADSLNIGTVTGIPRFVEWCPAMGANPMVISPQ